MPGSPDSRLNWNDLRYVLFLARAGSLVGAARRLGVNETTVARRIARIEADLGAVLFHRAERGRFPPTEAGEAVLAQASRIEQRVDALCAEIAGEDARPAGLVRLTSVPILANRLLAPASADLLRRHPGLELEIVAEPRNLDLAQREADIALRLAPPGRRSGDALRARRLGRLDYAVYVSAADDPPPPSGAMPWVGYERAKAHLPQARWIAEAIERGEGRLAPLACNDSEGVLQAVAAGAGRSLLPCAVADAHPGLRRIAPKEPPALSREVWALTHPEQRALARVGLVLEWLAMLFREVEARGPSAGR